MTKQTFQIPDGCKVVTVEQVGNQIITTFEPEFKSRDVLISHDKKVLIIFKEYTNEDIIESYFNNITDPDNYGWIADGFCLATPEEAQQLWDVLAKQGKRWNPETMEVEELEKELWRAEEHGAYYTPFNGDSNFFDHRDNTDDLLYESGFYCKTKEQNNRLYIALKQATVEFWKKELK